MKHWTEFTEDDLKKAWDIHWYWEWVINDKWPMTSILKSPSALSIEHIAPMLKERGIHTILDVTCGFGLKTILLQKQGFKVSGSDISAVAVKHARELTNREQLSLEYKVSAWSSLSTVWEEMKFDCVFCDALSWTPNEVILTQACQNFYEVLNDTGILLWAGAPKDKSPRNDEELAIELYRSKPAFQIHGPWVFKDGTHLTRVVCRELDKAGVVVHRAYLVTQGSSQKIELSSIVEPTCWSWDRVWSLLKSAGFAGSETVETSIDGKKRLHNLTSK